MRTLLNTILIVVGLTFLQGCEGLGGGLPDYKHWKKSGVDEFEVKRKMLECGMPAFQGTTPDWTKNEKLAYKRCMEGFGFRATGTTSSRGWCKDYGRDVAMCHRDGPVPAPSVARRLNSQHCREKRYYHDCGSDAKSLTDCKRIENKTPLPECMP